MWVFLFPSHTQLLVPLPPLFMIALVWCLFHHEQPAWLPKPLSSFKRAKYPQKSGEVLLHFPLTGRQPCSCSCKLTPCCPGETRSEMLQGTLLQKAMTAVDTADFLTKRWRTKQISKCSMQSCHLARINDSMIP